jgi:dCTP deaminase
VSDGLVITPLPVFDDVRLGSVNLGVGSTFLVSRRASIPFLEAGDPARSRAAFTEVRLASGESIVLQPQQFALACTREYVCLPEDVAGEIQSRSTYGRMGLIAATATYVTPGYRGCPTLELVNAGEVPVKVTPGERICQLILLSADEDRADLRPSRYQCAVRPFASRPH